MHAQFIIIDLKLKTIIWNTDKYSSIFPAKSYNISDFSHKNHIVVLQLRFKYNIVAELNADQGIKLCQYVTF